MLKSAYAFERRSDLQVVVCRTSSRDLFANADAEQQGRPRRQDTVNAATSVACTLVSLNGVAKAPGPLVRVIFAIVLGRRG